MDFQYLCELADKEIRLGVYDRELMAKAEKEAGGVSGLAHQIYWRLRATSIQNEETKRSSSGGESYAYRLSLQLETEGRKQKCRQALTGWLWVVACFASLVGAYVFPRIAMSRAIRGSFLFYEFAVTGVVCLILAGITYVASKRHLTTK